MSVNLADNRPGKIVAVDFDGTIVEHMYPDIGRPVPGAFETLAWLREHGVRLILLTMRDDNRDLDGPVLSDAVAFCRSHGVEFWSTNNNPEQAAWTLSPKVYAHLYIDDAAAGVPLRESIGCARPCVDWFALRPVLAERLGIKEQGHA